MGRVARERGAQEDVCMGKNIDGGVGFVCERWCVQSTWTCVSVSVCKVLERECKCLFVGVCVCL